MSGSTPPKGANKTMSKTLTYTETGDYLLPDLKLSEPPPFDYRVCTKADFIIYCNQHNIKKDIKINFAWDMLREDLSNEELADKFNYSIESIGKTKSRIQKELNLKS